MTIQQKQQLIRSLIQNFEWETNPNWSDELEEIGREILDYWNEYK